MQELCYFYQWLKHLCNPLWLRALLPFGSVAVEGSCLPQLHLMALALEQDGATGSEG